MSTVRLAVDEWMPVLRTMREIGRITQVKGIMAIIQSQAKAEELDRLAGELQDCDRWLEQAIAFEREHGKDSMIDRTHPVYAKVAESIRRFSGRKAEAAA